MKREARVARVAGSRVGRLLLLGLVVVAVGGTAQAAPSTKFYAVTLDPAAATAGSTAGHLLTLRNDPSSTQTLGSANVTVPAGFAVVSPAAGATVTVTASGRGKQWILRNAGGVLELRALTQTDALAPGETVGRQLTVATSCDAASATWTTTAKQSNSYNGPPGNDFLRAAADPFVTVQPGGQTTTLAFAQQPTRTQRGSAIAPAVTVRATDRCGAPVTSGDVTVALGANPGSATLGGTLTRSLDSTGTATFADLTVSATGTGYTLVATSGAPTATSDPFDVVDRLCTDADSECRASDAGLTTTVSTGRPEPGATMAFTFSGLGATFTCEGATLGVIGSKVTVDPQGYANPIEITLLWDKSVAPGTGVANFVFCLSKDDGATYFIVPKCGKTPAPTCELKRNRTGVGDLEIVLLLAPLDPIGAIG